MATKLANRRECNSQTIKNNYDWKYTKIPIDRVYKKKVLKVCPSYSIKDFEETMTVNRTNADASVNLLSSSFFESFITKQHKFVHLGLVQIAVNPLMRDGLGAPVVVGLRDARQPDFHKSLLAHVKVNISLGPFYFECFPSFSVSLDLDDASLFKVLTLDVETGGVDLALAYRVVCKAMVDLSPDALKKPVLGKTVYVQPAIGIRGATLWYLPESSTNEQDPNSDDHVLEKGCSISSKSANEQGSYHATSLLDEWKHAKIPIKKVYKSTKGNMFKVLDLFRGISLLSKSEKGSVKLPTVIEYEKTITLNDTNEINETINLLESLVIRNKVEKGCLLHLGLFQVAVKPLTIDDDLRAPIVVFVRDNRLVEFYNSLRAVVEANVCEGPFYFNHSPGHSIPAVDYKCFTLTITSCVPLVLTYRVVCYVTPHLSNVTYVYRDSNVRGETTYYHPLTGTSRTTNWDDVQVLKSSKV